MPRGGRALELLVARLEAVVTVGGADVKSPDYLLGRNSKSNREVDVTARSKVGTTEVLVMFECRDRSDNEDVRWIEEVANKREDVGADVVVAVSSAGFTSGARNTAEAKGVKLRTVSEITPEDVLSWCRLDHIEFSLVEVREQGLRVLLFDDTPPAVSVSPLHRLDPMLLDVPVNVPFATLWDASSGPAPRVPAKS